MTVQAKVVLARKTHFGCAQVKLERTTPAALGQVAVSVFADKGLFDTSYHVTAKFTGKVVPESNERPDQRRVSSIEVTPRKATTLAPDGSVIASTDRTPTPVTGPEGVVGKGDDYVVSAYGKLAPMLAFLTTIKPLIGAPAIEVLTQAVAKLVDVTDKKGKIRSSI